MNTPSIQVRRTDVFAAPPARWCSIPVPVLTLAVACAAIGVAKSGWVSMLEYDALAVLDGEVWRMLTCHLTHYGASHLLWDVAMFALLAPFCEWRSRRRFACLLFVSSLAISAAIVLFQPRLVHYRGLSGIDSALFMFLAVDWLLAAIAARDLRAIVICVLASAVWIGKTLLEFTTNGAVFAHLDPTISSAPIAHLVGGMAGVLVRLLSVAELPPAVRISGRSRGAFR